jgi:hypothetical protein
MLDQGATMRKIMLLAAILAVLGMASQSAAARDHGFGFRHFSEHAVPKLHLRHHGLKFHHGGVFGKHGAFKSRHFGRFGHRSFSSTFGHVPRFKPRHFGHFGQGGLVLKFGDGDFVLRFGHVPRFQHRHFGHRHHHPGLFFGFDQPRRLRPWHDRSLAFEDRHELSGHGQSMPGSQGGQGGGVRRGAPPEALLKHLEEMGFRYVPELLRTLNP